MKRGLALAMVCLFVMALCGCTGNSKPENSMGTLESPVPVGTTIELSYQDEGSMDFTVKEVYVGEQAIEKANELEEYGLNHFDPVQGKKYVLIHYDIVAKEVMGDTFYFNPLYLSGWANQAQGETQWLYGDISPDEMMEGGSSSGWSMFLVDESDQAPLIQLQLDIYKDGKRCWFSTK